MGKVLQIHSMEKERCEDPTVSRELLPFALRRADRFIMFCNLLNKRIAGERGFLPNVDAERGGIFVSLGCLLGLPIVEDLASPSGCLGLLVIKGWWSCQWLLTNIL